MHYVTIHYDCNTRFTYAVNVVNIYGNDQIFVVRKIIFFEIYTHLWRVMVL